MPPIYFALIMDRRSGSTMLRNTLNQNPQIDCSDEIFNSYEAIDGAGWSGEIGYGATVEVFWRWRRADRSPEVKAVGTLIHRWQAEFFPGLIQLTRGLHTRFICIYRDNLLRQFLSEMIAMNTSIWSSDPEFVKTLPKMDISPEALRLFVATRISERAQDWTFQPRIEYSLENLFRGWDGITERLQHYIGVSPQPLIPTSKKQETRLLKDSIANYDEIAETVVNIGHSEWLDPPQEEV